MRRIVLAALGVASVLTLAPVVSSSFPLPVQPAFAATGNFMTDAKTTEGSFKIVEEEGKRYLELSDDFRTGRGPDVFVLLHREATPESYNTQDYVNLGQMDTFRGSQRYEIPATLDLDDFQSAVIWCREFSVTFGFAQLGE